jgi:hypothetical protein
MSETALGGSWLALLVLGASHGLNPSMGWLFAVALGLQERGAGAVWRALGPLAAGHAMAVAGALVGAALFGAVVPGAVLKGVVAGALVAAGLHRVLGNRHPRVGGMRIGAGGLAMWSFLMASAHGAGLMLVPFVLTGGGMHAAQEMQSTTHHPALAPTLAEGGGGGLAAAALHTAGYLLCMGLLALLVYRKLGLRLLGRAWVNLDLVWGGALILTGVVTPLL